MNFTTENFKTEVLESEVPVLVDFWADWCGPCKSLGPVIDEMAQTANGYKVGKVDVDAEGPLAKQYRVMSIPALKVFYQGKVVSEMVGVSTREEIEEMIQKAVTT